MVQAPNRSFSDRGRDRDRDRGRGRGRGREEDTGGFTERVVYTRRIAKVVKGGRRLRFNALVVVGDGQGQVGVGLGKALVIPDAVRKGNAVARRGVINIPMRGSTIPQQITVKKGATIVMIKPAREGTGVIANAAMRAILELGGVKDVVGKSLGSRNPINIVYATIEALKQLKDPDVELARRLGRPMPSKAPAEAPTGQPTEESPE
ncbi:MAG: 30S ribosomal protein S5 [Chloroflexi bacterium]|nr:30S ribosomal protein S5 [Chloroflexota bacterium]